MKIWFVAVLALIEPLSVVSVKRCSENKFKDFQQQFNKTYATEEEAKLRYEIFRNNSKAIRRHNKLFAAGKVSFDMAMNEFGDLTADEFVRIMLGSDVPVEAAAATTTTTTTTASATNAPAAAGNTTDADQGRNPGRENAFGRSRQKRQTLPATVNWVQSGFVTPVLNQGTCGCCYAFSAAGALEGQLRKKSGRLVQLSKQNLMDCVYGAAGCNGGWMPTCFDYVRRNGGISTEAGYPFTGRASATCRYNALYRATSATGYVAVPSSEAALQNAVATVGPISVAMDASQPSFQFYRSGVYNEPRCSSTTVNHGMLAVGYGTLNGVPYWLVKNSWGTTWGDRGYVLMSRNRNNQCAIALAASYPLL